MNFLLEATTATGGFPVSLGLVASIGFVAAAVLGSIAWYNSKRPVGWKDKERPDIVPNVDGSEG